MKRTIQIEIETSECGRYCGEDCSHQQFAIWDFCELFKKKLKHFSKKLKHFSMIKKYRRCEACLAAEKEVGR